MQIACENEMADARNGTVRILFFSLINPQLFNAETELQRRVGQLATATRASKRRAKSARKTRLALASELVSLQNTLILRFLCMNWNPPTFQARMQKSHLPMRQHRLSKTEAMRKELPLCRVARK